MRDCGVGMALRSGRAAVLFAGAVTAGAALAQAPDAAPAPVAAPAAVAATEAAAPADEPPLAATGEDRHVWELRSALNVAALGCRRPGEAGITPRYNEMLKLHNKLLSVAYTSEATRFRRDHGAEWQTIQDREMTKVYNRYANHPDQPLFCAAAASISAYALRVKPEDFARFAAASLERMAARAEAVRSLSPAAAGLLAAASLPSSMVLPPAPATPASPAPPAAVVAAPVPVAAPSTATAAATPASFTGPQ